MGCTAEEGKDEKWVLGQSLLCPYSYLQKGPSICIHNVQNSLYVLCLGRLGLSPVLFVNFWFRFLGPWLCLCSEPLLAMIPFKLTWVSRGFCSQADSLEDLHGFCITVYTMDVPLRMLSMHFSLSLWFSCCFPTTAGNSASRSLTFLGGKSLFSLGFWPESRVHCWVVL